MIPIGLDCIWDIDDEHEPNFEQELTLTAGLLSGSGEGSFRGKVYNVFVRHFTGFSLYEDLSNEQVTEIAETLDGLTGADLEEVGVDPEIVLRAEVPETFHSGYHGFRDEQEFADFKRMFRKYAEAGAELAAWY